MENIDTKRKSNMFKYVGNYTLYDIIGEYYPELEGNYSTAQLFNNVSPDLSIDNKFYSYHNIFQELTQRLLETVKKANRGEKTKFSQEELVEFYEELKECDTDEWLDDYDTIEEYLEYAMKNSRNHLLKDMRKKIVNAAFKYSDFSEQEENNYRSSTISLYIWAIGQQLNEKYKTVEEREDPLNEEWQEFMDLRRYLGNSENRKLYDEFIKNNKRERENKTFAKRKEIENCEQKINEIETEIRDIEEKQNLKDRCTAFRSYVVNQEIYRGLTVDEQNKLKKGETRDTVSTILGDFRAYPTPSKGTYVCEFREIEPQVILDTVADYSEGQVENQRVIAVSYGFLNYGTNISIDTRKPTQGSYYELELIGVTRKGIEGDSTYFTFTTFDNTSIKEKSEVKPEDDLVIENYYFNGLQGKLVDNKSGSEQVIVKSKRRIPEDLEQYYAQVFFSDVYMDAVDKFYSRYSGTVVKRMGKPCIVYERPVKTISEEPKDYLKAVRYANRYPIYYNGNMRTTMDSYCNSGYLKAKQKKIVEKRLSMSKGKRDTNESKKEDDEYSL